MKKHDSQYQEEEANTAMGLTSNAGGNATERSEGPVDANVVLLRALADKSDAALADGACAGPMGRGVRRPAGNATVNLKKR